MKETGFKKTPLITGFAGENRTLAETLLPFNLSPDAKNNDYSDGTAKKRKGFRRGHSQNYYAGSIEFFKNGDSAAIVVGSPTPSTRYVFSGSCAYSVMIKRTAFAPGGEPYIDCRNGSRGFVIQEAGGVFQLIAETAAGTVTINSVESVTSGGLSGTSHFCVMFVYQYNPSGNHTYHLIINTEDNTASSANAYVPQQAANAYQLVVGGGYVTSGTTGASYASYKAADIRMWDLSSLTNAEVSTWISDHATNLLYTRELSESEIADTKLAGYWKLNAPASSDYQGDVPIIDEKGYNTSANSEVQNVSELAFFSERIINGANNYPRALGLFECGGITEIASDDNERQAFLSVAKSSPEYWTWTRAAGISHIDTIENYYELEITQQNSNPWHATRFRDLLILCNEGVANYKFYLQSGSPTLRFLTPGSPGVGSTVAADSGAGAGFTGCRRYLFVNRNSTDGSESIQSGIVESAVIVDNSGWNLSNIDTAGDDQIDKVDIYATLVSASQPAPGPFYFLATINEGTTTYADTTTDAVLIENALFDSRRGKAAAAKVPFVWDNRLWLLYDDQCAYAEITGDIIPRPSHDRFYSGNILPLGIGDQDIATGVAVANQTAYIFKYNSIWQLNGSTPSTYNAQKLVDCPGRGCVAHKTIAQSLRGVYWMSPTGISFMPFGGAPQDITHTNQRSFFEGLTRDNWRYASACWWPIKGEYRVSFRSNDETITLVFNEERQTWAYWDEGCDDYAVVPLKTGEIALFGAWQGYIIELERGNNDGAYIEDTAIAVVDTITGFGANYILDSGASFPTTGSGLNGVRVGIMATDGTWQFRRVLHNTNTRIWFYEDLDPAPVVGDTYTIGPINWSWRTPKKNISDDISGKFQTHRLWTWFRQDGNSNTVAIEHVTDSNTGIQTSTSSGTRIDNILLDNAGREISLEFSNPYPEQPIELEAFQVAYQDRGEW